MSVAGLGRAERWAGLGWVCVCVGNRGGEVPSRSDTSRAYAAVPRTTSRQAGSAGEQQVGSAAPAAAAEKGLGGRGGRAGGADPLEVA